MNASLNSSHPSAQLLKGFVVFGVAFGALTGIALGVITGVTLFLAQLLSA